MTTVVINGTRIGLGSVLELAYPAHNRHGVPLEFVSHAINVTSIRDFGVMPMDAKKIVRRPLIRRGRFLITGFDHETKEPRKFWFEARKGGRLPEWRLGLVDPAFPGEVVDWIGRIHGPTGPEQLRMRKLALRWFRIVKERGEIGLNLAAFPVDR